MLANDGFSGAVSVAVIKQPVICSDLEKDRRELSKMKYRARAPSMSWGFLVVVLLALGSKMQKSEALDYSDALEKALMFYEGQRSGALPPDQRLLWRGDSALTDGDASGVCSAHNRFISFHDWSRTVYSLPLICKISCSWLAGYTRVRLKRWWGVVVTAAIRLWTIPWTMPAFNFQYKLNLVERCEV